MGQTGGMLVDRFEGHFTMIRRRDMSKDIGRHFNSDDHEGKDDVKINVQDFIYTPSEVLFSKDIRLHVEFDWIQELHTMLMFGMNSWDKAPTPMHLEIHQETGVQTVRPIIDAVWHVKFLAFSLVLCESCT